MVLQMFGRQIAGIISHSMQKINQSFSIYSCNTTQIRHPTIFSIAGARSSTDFRISKLKDSRQWTLCRNTYIHTPHGLSLKD
jgi:hypothetical protein